MTEPFELNRLYNCTHLLILFFHATKKFVLSMCSDDVVLWIVDAIVLVTVDVVHQEAEHLFEGDVACREREPLKF